MKHIYSGRESVNQVISFNALTRIIIVISLLCIFPAGSMAAGEKLQKGAGALLESYQRNSARLEKNSFGIPLYVESSEQGDRVHVDVYGILFQPFNGIAIALKEPSNWCDIVFLHPNVKACSYHDLAGTWLLNFHLGRKTYQPPEDADPVITRFRNIDHPGYLDVMLNSDIGPYGTRDHRMRFEALPLEGGKTFVRVSYSYRDSAALRLAAKIYFATLGRGKVGFTVTGTDSTGKPEYIGGPRGALERSAVRYYFAIQSFMNTQHYPEEKRFNARISEWHDLTSRYRKQLFDLDKKEYVAVKTREHANQVALQRRVVEGHL